MPPAVTAADLLPVLRSIDRRLERLVQLEALTALGQGVWYGFDGGLGTIKVYTPTATGAQEIYKNTQPRPVLVRFVVSSPAAANTTFDLSPDPAVPAAKRWRLAFDSPNDATPGFVVPVNGSVYGNPSATGGSLLIQEVDLLRLGEQ